MTMRLDSAAFAEAQSIPVQHTCEGDDSSPALSWRGQPGGCRSFAIICEDPDAPGGIWYHWAVFDIPGDLQELAGNVPTQEQMGGLRQALNSFHRIGYAGPCPPPGHGRHHYRFRLLALPVAKLDVPARPTCAAVSAAARQIALAEAVLTGTYQR